MSFWIREWASRVAPVRGTQKQILDALAGFASENGVAWPSVPTLADRAGRCERTARNALRALEAAGLVVTVPSRGRTSNRYRLAVTAQQAEALVRAQAERRAQPGNPADPAAPTRQNVPGNPAKAAAEQIREDTTGTARAREFDFDEEGEASTPRPEAPSPRPAATAGDDAEKMGEAASAPLHDPDLGAILEAAGADETGATPQGARLGRPRDRLEVQRWRNELELSLAEIVAVIVDVMSRDEVPEVWALRYFSGAMRDFAGRKAEPAMQPSAPPERRERQAPWRRRGSAARAAQDEAIGIAAERLAAATAAQAGGDPSPAEDWIGHQAKGHASFFARHGGPSPHRENSPAVTSRLIGAGTFEHERDAAVFGFDLDAEQRARAEAQAPGRQELRALEAGRRLPCPMPEPAAGGGPVRRFSAGLAAGAAR